MLPGVYSAKKKNGTSYYRASITYRGKHISLGSYATEVDANKAYEFSYQLLHNLSGITVDDYDASYTLPFDKWVVLLNFRDNGIYFKNPIYLRKKYFIYYLDRDTALKFDVDDLFYYAHHKIMRRGGHLFVSDYGMQVNILSRYGIKNYAVPGRDYISINGDPYDFRYHNIEVVNRYHGVTKILLKGKTQYLAKIHVKGNYLIGRYNTDTEAAIAYNKAALLLNGMGLEKRFPQNYIDEVDEIGYASLYQKIRISKKLLAYAATLKE